MTFTWPVWLGRGPVRPSERQLEREGEARGKETYSFPWKVRTAYGGFRWQTRKKILDTLGILRAETKDASSVILSDREALKEDESSLAHEAGLGKCLSISSTNSKHLCRLKHCIGACCFYLLLCECVSAHMQSMSFKRANNTLCGQEKKGTTWV